VRQTKTTIVLLLLTPTYQALQPGVKKIAQGIAQHIEPEDSHTDGNSGKDSQPRVLKHKIKAFPAKGPSPGRCRWWN